MDLPNDQTLALARISACVALHDERQLKIEINSAFDSGLSVLLIREAILQCYLFAGYAAAINAFVVLKEMRPGGNFLREESGSVNTWKARGRRLCRRIYGSQYEKMIHNMKQLHPDLSDWMLWEGYGKVLSRPFLSPRVRELLIVGTTAVLNVERQFHSHVKGALHVGATAADLAAVMGAIKPLMPARIHARFTRLQEKLATDAH